MKRKIVTERVITARNVVLSLAVTFVISALTVTTYFQDRSIEQQKGIQRIVDAIDDQSESMNAGILIKNRDGIESALADLSRRFNLKYIEVAGVTVGRLSTCSQVQIASIQNPLMNNIKHQISFCLGEVEAHLHPVQIILLFGIAISLIFTSVIWSLLIAKKETSEEIASASATAAHNILPILELIRSKYEQINTLDPEVRKPIIKSLNEIHVICSNWLKTSKGQEVIDDQSVTFISGIVFEMSFQMALALDPRIKTHFEYDLDAFATVVRTEFITILANIITNSVQALENIPEARINVSVSTTNVEVLIAIQDNGPGISEHIRENLGKQGITTKPSGSGVGLSHAIRILDSWGGSLEFHPVEVGAKVVISLPKSPVPEWFAKEINVNSEEIVVIIDDSEQIRNAISFKFKSLPRPIEIITVGTRDELRKVVARKDVSKMLFLFDQHIGELGRGTELISEFGLKKQSILVTSADDEQQLRYEAIKLGIKICPKSMIAEIPVRLND